MKRISLVEKEVLLMLFEEWLHHVEATGELPAPTGFSPRKRLVALYQALSGPLTLPEIAAETKTDVSLGVLKIWRTKPPFKEFAHRAAKSFATFLEGLIIEPDIDQVRRLVLSELLILLSGFNIGDNLVVQEIQQLLNSNMDSEAIKRLYCLLLTYRDIVRLGYDHWGPAKMEDKVSAVLNPIIDKTEAVIRANSEMLGGYDNLFRVLIISLIFLANLSKIVV